MKMNKLFLRWITVFGMVMMFAVSGWSDNNNNNGSCNLAESVTLDYTSSGASAGSADSNDYYAFTPTTSGTLTATISGSSKDLDMFLYNSNCSNELKKDDGNSNNPTFTYSVTAGTTYKLRVNYYPNSGSTNYTLNLSVGADYSHSNFRTFTIQRQDNIYGDMQIIGNSIILKSGGVCAPNGTPNNDIDAIFADKDTDATTYNSTSANLKLPKGVDSTRIQYAYLYWQGRTWSSGNTQNGKTMKLKTYGDIGYTTINTNLSKFNWNSSGDYQGVADVTDQIKHSIDQVPLSTINSTGYDQPVWGADVYASLNSNDNNFGAWSLVVVYKENTTINPTAKFRSITLFDGYLEIFSNNQSFPLNGFLTPKTGVVDAKFLMFGGEGDISYSDGLTLTNSVNTAIKLPNAPGTPAGTESVWGSSEDINGVNVTNRNPNCQNTIGIDMRTFSVGTSSSNPIIGNNQTSTTITLKGTGNDQYFPGVFAFSTELYMPQLCYDYSFKQDGQYLKAANNGSSGILPRLTGIVSNSPLETSVYIRNKEADISVNAVSFFTDLNTTLFNYIPGSTASTNVNASGYTTRADSTGSCSYDSTSTSSVACNDGHNVRIGLGNGATGYGQTTAGSLGSEEFVYAKFELEPTFSGIRDVNESLGLKLNYYIQPDTSTAPIVYTYTLGQDINLCPPSSGYNPVWGTFNVVDHYASSVNGLPANNLRTQVSRKPFEVDVATYEKNTDGKYTKKPTIDMNTTVVVEVIDNDAFHDVNASCANPGSVITSPIYVGIANTSKDMTIDIPKQDIAYHNFAVKNAAYRLWYFANQDQSLINWNAYTSDTTRRNLTSINGLYQSGYHTVCSTACASPTSTTCFNCIKINYAKPLCSRDNFAVRPESYDLRIYDINQSLSQTSALKDSTKINLSKLYHYTPDYNSATGRMNVAAGYNYRYDINATGNDTNLTKVPGYTRYFSGASNDYNATMIWEPDVGHITTGCNDRTGKNLNFYVANGQMLNTEQNQTQVGEYRLNIIDPAWTAVDWDSTLTTHHTNSNGFEATKEDCIVGVDTTTASEGMIGCTTTSLHSGGGYTYKDHLLRLKPAKFDLSSLLYGIGKTPLAITTGGVGFVYDSDLNVTNDMAMSVRSYGPLKAVGYGGETLSNFVTQCYSTDLNVSISHDANTSIPFSGRMTVAEIGGTQIFDSLEFNAKKSALQMIDDTYFHKIDNGQTVPTIRLNFDRNSTTPILPQIVHYGDFNVSCSIPSDCNMSAMSNSITNTAKGHKVMDFSVTHAYGRLIARDIKATWMQPFNEIGKYEVYKTSNLIGTALSPDQFDADWYVNVLHTDANYGDANVTVIDPSNGASLPTESNSLNGIETFAFPTFTVRQGYRGHIDTEGWLWYGGVNALPYADPNGPAQAGADNLNCLTHPCFGISLGRIIGNTGSAKTESEAHKANKKTTSTGWSTTSEYAPAVR